MTSKEILIQLCGQEKVDNFVEVKRMSMRLAAETKKMIAADLGGTIPLKGKQFLTTNLGQWRLASSFNSDNTTEQKAHANMGVKTVQIFGEISDSHREKGIINLEDLYSLHNKTLDWGQILTP